MNEKNERKEKREREGLRRKYQRRGRNRARKIPGAYRLNHGKKL